MRNLIITRNKAIAGCAARLHVYITDPDSGDLFIHGTPCRKLGALKNGETGYFPVEDTAARVYVIADQLSKDLYCEYCDLLPGSRDVVLSGKCRFDPLNGNPFHFDGNTAAPKTKNLRLFIISLLCVLVISGGLVLGALIPRLMQEKELAKPQVFTAEGMQITLTKAFRQLDASEIDFTLCYGSQDTTVYVIKESFSSSAEFQSLSAETYAQLVLSGSEYLSGGRPVQEEGLITYQYTEYNYADGNDYSYLMVFLKGPDAFWIFEFSTEVSNSDSMRQTYLEYAKTICFPGAAI